MYGRLSVMYSPLFINYTYARLDTATQLTILQKFCSLANLLNLVYVFYLLNSLSSLIVHQYAHLIPTH